MKLRLRIWLFLVFPAALLLFLSATPWARAAPAAVTIHDRGKKIAVTGEAAKKIAGVCADLLETSRMGGALGVKPTTIDHLRGNEISVEIDYGSLRTFEVAGRKDRSTRAQYLLVPVTGDYAGLNGGAPLVFLGRIAPEEHKHNPFLVNPPDRNGIQYDGTPYLDLEKGLIKLKELVRAQGVELD